MAFDHLDLTKPDGVNQSGTPFDLSILANQIALVVSIILGSVETFVYTQSGGTTALPAIEYWKSGNNWLRRSLTYAAGQITVAVYDWSVNGGGAWTNILTENRTYDSGGFVTTTTNGGGLVARLEAGVGRLALLKTAYDTHAALTIAGGAHSAGSMAAQNASAVAVTGGTLTGVAIEYTTARAKKIDLGTISGAVNVDWAAADTFYGTFSGTGGSLVWVNLPGAGAAPAGAITLELTNSGLATNPWPAGIKWPSASAPTRTSSGIDEYEFRCRDGANVRGSQSLRDFR